MAKANASTQPPCNHIIIYTAQLIGSCFISSQWSRVVSLKILGL